MHIGGASSKTRKDKTFDSAGSQVLSFRMRSEWLYYRKNYGLATMLMSAGIELLWFFMRYLKNLLIPSGDAARKKELARSTMSQVTRSVSDTRFGKVSPPIPW